jgi:hypothetical protein
MSVKDAAERFSIKRIDQILPSKGRLIAIDPGGNTGIATKVDGVYKTETTPLPDVVFAHVNNGDWDVVIYEDFNTGGNISKDGQHTLKVIGGILALCWRRDIKPYRQMPQERMAFLARANSILKKSSLKPTNHEKDALAHLLRWEYNAAEQVQD